MHNKVVNQWIFSDHRSFGPDILKILGIALVYYFAHQISFFFPDSGKVIMLIWPAGGIGLAAFLLNKRRLWPFLTIAFYIAGITANVFLAKRSFITAFGYMTGNMAESIGCAWLILYWNKDFKNFTRSTEILTLIFCVLFVNAFSSCIGAYTSALTHGASFIESWQSWYIADGLGLLLIAPLIVSWLDFKNLFTGLNLKKIIETAVFFCFWTVICMLIFQHIIITRDFVFHPYLLVVFLSWPALRLGQRSITLALTLLFVIAIISPVIVYGPSPWDQRNLDYSSRLLELELFLAFLAAAGYLMSAGHSDRKRAEDALRESETRIKSISNNFVNGMIYQIVISPDGRRKFTYLSDSVRQLYGISPEEGMSDSSLIYNKIHEDDIKPLIKAENKAIKTFTTFKAVARVKDPSGKIRWSSYVSTPKIMEDGSTCWDGIEFIITERKQAEELLQESEERLSLVFNNNYDQQLLISIEPDGEFRILKVNNTNIRTIQKMGFKISEKDFINKTIKEVLSGIFRMDKVGIDKTLKYFGQAVDSGKPVVYEETFHSEKIHYFSEVSIVPVLGKDGKCIYVLYTSHNITERKLAEKELNKRMEELEAWQKVTIGRETRVIELKKEVNDLLAKQGLPQRYKNPDE